MTAAGYWYDDAVCAHVDPAVFEARTPQGQRAAINDYCRYCPVRADCLADALHAPEHQDRGVRGGKTRKERQALRQRPDLPTGRDPVTIAALRRLLDAEQPDVPRHPAPRPKPRRAAPKETTVHEKPTPAPAPEKPAAAQAPVEPLAPLPAHGRSIADFLDWAEQHPQAAIRKHAAKAREALAAIEQRYAADTELDQVQQELERARKRLAALEARAKELARPGAKAAPARDYDTAEVRAWAQRAGVACPAFGKIPATVLAAWRKRDAA